MIGLKPISKVQYEAALLVQKVEEAIGSIPEPIKGRDGAQGASGRDGKDGKDGITTTVTREVLANKEKLLEKEEFEEFKAMMLKMEQDIRSSLAQTHNYFPGGGGGLAGELANVIEVSTSATISNSQLIKSRINVVLVTAPGITVTLPEPDATIIVWVQQGYTEDGEFTVCRE